MAIAGYIALFLILACLVGEMLWAIWGIADDRRERAWLESVMDGKKRR